VLHLSWDRPFAAHVVAFAVAKGVHFGELTLLVVVLGESRFVVVENKLG
jgi:hypothetical protein